MANNNNSAVSSLIRKIRTWQLVQFISSSWSINGWRWTDGRTEGRSVGLPSDGRPPTFHLFIQSTYQTWWLFVCLVVGRICSFVLHVSVVASFHYFLFLTVQKSLSSTGQNRAMATSKFKGHFLITIVNIKRAVVVVFCNRKRTRQVVVPVFVCL